MRFRTALAQIRRDQRPKVVHLAAHGLVGDRDLALRQQILDVTKAALLVFPVIKGLCELGHGRAVKRSGGDVHEFGVMLLVLFPVPY
jgi:hypothetical protein